MTPEEASILAPLVDVQPVYNIMSIVTSPNDLYSRTERAFVRAKLKRAAKIMRQTAKYIEDKLKESQLSDPSKGKGQ